MASFVVLEPVDARGPEDAVFVRDGFSFLAFLVPVIWLAFHRVWVAAGVALVLSLVIGFGASAIGLGGAGNVLLLLLSVYFGLEGNALRIAALRRRGHADRGVVEAADMAEAELRYFAPGAGPEPAPPLAMRAALRARPAPAGPSMGLFDPPERA